ncbi:MAG TPA: SET domain-containing protein [Nitrososphaerales archaeon]|nr:SET domain-containing protein [Nitrososphaerales archaeon]HUK79234.1 SET domain-containing protein [Nitrososphaerales archaeon]
MSRNQDRMKSGLEIKKSPIHGRGVFATVRIPKTTVVEEIKGEAQCYSKIPSALLLRRGMEVSKDVYIVPAEGSVGWFLNHANRPNCTYDISTREIRATKDISRGEELTIDYHDTTTWPGYATLWKGGRPP